MDAKREKKLSKFLSYVLRHQPQSIGLALDEQGWAKVPELLSQARKHQQNFTIEELNFVVANNAKQRFRFNENAAKIRANQGHSIAVDLKLNPEQPPQFLYHGTVEKFLPDIKESGLQKMNRHHVHLSPDKETATNVGSRRGKPIILVIRAADMWREGFLFYQSENGVWLTEKVPSQFIEFH
ncbi:MAG: RNA 2'-phosphotransferase [Bacteroidota bacterium]